MWSKFPVISSILLIMTGISSGQVELATDGRAKAVIVSPHPVNVPPAGAVGIATLSLSSTRSGTLLHESFDGQPGASIAPRGWQAREGSFVIGPSGIISAKRGQENQFRATADKPLPIPHRVTEDNTLTLRFVLHLPGARKEEAWTYVRLHTAEGKRWTHGFKIEIGRQGTTASFALAAEPSDPDRVPIPNDSGSVIELQMVLGAKRVTWSWRPHGTDEPWRSIASWGVAEPPTITGVRLVSSNHIDNSADDHEAKRLVSAAQDLAMRLEQITGGPFLAVTEDQAPGEMSRIFVGDTPTIRALCPDVDFQHLGADEILVRTVGNDLVLSGGRPRGYIYAIYTFLQDQLGCRFWEPDAIHIPRTPNLQLPLLNIRYQPPLEFRVFSGLIGSKHETRVWHRLSFDLQFDPGTHSIPKLLPKKLFTQHPDWFMYCPDDDYPNEKYSYKSTLRNFQRTIETETERTDLDQIAEWIEIAKKTRRLPQQPCVQSKGARETITRNALAELEQKYPSWTQYPKVLWITQNDGRGMCRCADCKAIQESEGSDSANWLMMVNDIAEKVAQKYPDVLVGMFAYLHTEAAPRTLRARDNVLIYSALLQSNKRDSVSHYAGHANDLRRWSQIAKHHWVWDYDANFRNFFQPHPNYYVHLENMKFFREIGTHGAMVQAAWGQAADMAAMRTWITAQMLWDPDQDPRQLMMEFTNGYYGPAGRWVMMYIDLMLAAVQRNSDYWLGCYRTDTTGWLELEDVHAAIYLLEQAARAVADDAVLSHRVWMARRHIDFAWLDRYDEFVETAQEKNIALNLPDPVAVVDSLAPYRNAWGNFREGPRPADFYVYFDKLRTRFPQ